jgi:hypothetical protein
MAIMVLPPKFPLYRGVGAAQTLASDYDSTRTLGKQNYAAFYDNDTGFAEMARLAQGWLRLIWGAVTTLISSLFTHSQSLSISSVSSLLVNSSGYV